MADLSTETARSLASGSATVVHLPWRAYAGLALTSEELTFASELTAGVVQDCYVAARDVLDIEEVGTSLRAYCDMFSSQVAGVLRAGATPEDARCVRPFPLARTPDGVLRVVIHLDTVAGYLGVAQDVGDSLPLVGRDRALQLADLMRTWSSRMTATAPTGRLSE